MEDHRTGDTICTSCGFVMLPSHLADHAYAAPYSSHPQHYAAAAAASSSSSSFGSQSSYIPSSLADSSYAPSSDAEAAAAAAAATSHSTTSSTSAAAATATPPTTLQLDFVENVILRDKILHACSLLHLDENAGYVECVVNLFKEGYVQQCRRKRRNATSASSPPSPLYALTTDESNFLLAFALWEALNRQGTPWSPHAIACMFGIDAQKLLKAEKQFGLGATYCGLLSQVETECNHMLLPYAVTKLVKSVAAKIETSCYGRKPQQIIAACLHSVIVQHDGLQAVGDRQRREWLTAKYIQERFAADSKTIKKILNMLPEYTIVDGEIIFKPNPDVAIVDGELVFKK